ncbi:hypothetical protein Leryth_008935 [Lithospermum erythrorhizon]|nr:hypothetical protein Leryth_008935 [Lithospermum erythrorhizon]
MGNIIAFLEVKPGYGTYVHDFQMTNKLNFSQEERIGLFVARTNNIDTSSCLINPTDTSILINGRGVDKRHTNCMETGPQRPTLVNHYVKDGTNLLQAVGQFNGNYIIIIAFMRVLSIPDHAALQDYVQPTTSMVDSDPEITEGSSRISLNCPISFKRINVPVKGHMCKHLQCTDFKNYIEMNERRPLWRCPHCYQHLCFTDIRVDQNMVKVLKEIGETVNEVLISSDLSWKPVTEIEDHRDKPRKDDAEVSTNPVDHEPSDIHPDDIMDVTEDDYMGTTEMCETTDKKLFSSSCQNQASQQNMAVNEANQNNVVPVGDNSWSEIYKSTLESGVPRHASVRPVSVQALPVSSPTTYSLQQTPIFRPMIQNSSLVVPQASVMPRIGDSPSRVQQSSVSQTPSYVNSYKLTPVFPSGNDNSSQHRIPNTRENVNQSTTMTPSATSSPPQTSQGDSPAGMVSNNRDYELLVAQWVAKKARWGLASTTSPPYAMNYDRHGAALGGQRSNMPPSPSCPPVNSDVPMGMTAVTTESSCQPSVGRMRGALTGRAFADAYNYHITQTTQQPQATTQHTKASSQPAASTTLSTQSTSLPVRTTTQHTKASSQPATSTTLSTESTSLPVRATTQSSQATIHPDSAKSHPPIHQNKATIHPDSATSQPARTIHPHRTHASRQQVQAALRQTKSTTPVSIANSREEVVAANRCALAQAGIRRKPGSGSSYGAPDEAAHRN